MTYIDGFVFVVTKKNIPEYVKMAEKAGKIWKKYGALKYVECVGDDLSPQMAKLTFPKMTKLKSNETVWFSFIVYKNKEHRDKVNALVMKDPIMNEYTMKDKPMTFDMKRMAFAGFKSMVEY